MIPVERGIAPPSVQAGLNLTPYLYLLSVEQYEDLSRRGFFTENDQVELLEGRLIKKMTKDEPHVVCSLLFTESFPRLIPAGWVLSFENPIGIFQSLPEPDMMIVRGKPRDFLGKKIPPENVGVLVEISDITLSLDRGAKLQIYARGGILICWIVNLNDNQIEVYTEPFAEGEKSDYRKREIFTAAHAIPLMLDGQEIAKIPAAGLLP